MGRITDAATVEPSEQPFRRVEEAAATARARRTHHCRTHDSEDHRVSPIRVGTSAASARSAGGAGCRSVTHSGSARGCATTSRTGWDHDRASRKEEAEKRPGIDIPLQSAPLGRRLIASMVDGIIIAVASALFGFIFWKVTAVRPAALQICVYSAAIPCLFWAAYQYLLIVYSASTPGIAHRTTGADSIRWHAQHPRSMRRWRVLASYLSAASLGMGYAWLFLDEDVSLLARPDHAHLPVAPSRYASGALRHGAVL